MINVTHWPVVIYANYRTGSTALGYWLAQKYNCKYFNEPIYRKPVFDEFTEHYKSGNTQYVIKFMGDHILEDDLYKNLLTTDAFKIRLYRENKVEQIASYYVSAVTKRWRTTAEDNIEDYNLPLDTDMLKESIRRITYNDQLLDESTINFDLTCSYESLGFLDDVHLTLTKQPTNIKTIHSLTRSLLNSKLKT
jgi:LPS sulfotransferase NodH